MRISGFGLTEARFCASRTTPITLSVDEFILSTPSLVLFGS